MIKQLLFFLFALIYTSSFSQEIIENPKYGTRYKKHTLITKIELNQTETILHITSRNQEKDSITVPETIYLSDENSNKKMFVLKSEGISLNAKTALNHDNEISYKLFFPPLDKSVNVINLLIEKAPIGTWKGQPRKSTVLAYRIDIRPTSKALNFQKTPIEQAFVKARKDNKNVLLFFTAPWCGPCNWMKNYLHSDSDVKALMEANYIALTINRDTQKGSKLANEYNCNGIPYYVLLTPENKLLKTHSGSCKKDVFLKFLTPDKTITPKTIEKPKPKKTNIDPSIGVRLGLVNNTFSNTGFNSRTGFTADLFYSKEIDDLYLLRTGIGFNSKGYEHFSVNYLRIPFEFGLKVLNGSLINTQGGIRAMVAPYYAVRLNKGNKNLRWNDYGVRVGLSHFVGSDNELELELYYEHGMQDVFKSIHGNQNNRSFGVSLLLAR